MHVRVMVLVLTMSAAISPAGTGQQMLERVWSTLQKSALCVTQCTPDS